MRSQIKLGRIFGIEIGLHYSWFLIALLIFFSLSSQFHAVNPQWGSGTIAALAAITAVAFFVSLLLHELAHSMVATANGLPVREITLFALGGVSQIVRDPTNAKLEFWIAMAGPLTSFLIGFICMAATKLIGGAGPWAAVLSWLAYINLGLGAFNLIPGYPLDGGRILRALIWWKTGDADRSTRIAATVGQVVAFCFIALGIFRYFSGFGFGGLWIAFIGWFLLQAARESYRRAGLAHVLDEVRVSDVMTRDCSFVSARQNIQDFVEHELLRTGRRCFIVADDGEIAGLVTAHEIKQIERAKWPYVTLRDVMRPVDTLHAVSPEAPLSTALNEMSRYDLNQLPVVSDNHVDGVLSRADVLNYLQTHAELGAKA
jgi:Zn-dependent protease/predicted transcriptional regulator